MCDLLQACRAELEEAVALRRHLHRHPELTGREEETIRYIAARLDAVGIPWQEIPQGGILARIDGAVSGKTVLLRADCDALPIQESPMNAHSPKLCVSQTPGVAHMCGHDAHTAMLLGAGRILWERREQLRGSVLLLFERGEEGGGGIYHVMRFLQTRRIRVDSCWANHVVPDLPVGSVAIQGGTTNAAVFDFELCLRGKGGHASRPDRACSPIDCFTAIAQRLQGYSMRHTSPFEPLTYCISSVHAGSAANIIPDQLQFQGTCRFFDLAAGRAFERALRQTVEECCAAYGCTAEYPLFSESYLPTCCAQELAAFGREVVGAQLGRENIVPRGPAMGAESFGILSAFYPCVTAKVGVRNERMGCTMGVHTPHFDMDESALTYGMLMYTVYAIEYLRQAPSAASFVPYPGSIAELYASMGCRVPDDPQ